MSIHGALLTLAAALSLATACKDTQGAGADAPTGKPAQVAPADQPVTQPADKPADPPADKPMPVILPAEKSEPAGPGAGGPLVECTPDSRKGGMCTREYRPVCGKTAADVRKTYSNPCNACSDTAVIGYVAGACEAGPK